ncbi:MAG: 30S ribosome-binding factor RbfA [Candidatus Omnitrophota bacterium]|jgi:ribosome-binding factor A
MSRHDKVQETLKREISIILQSELKDPRLGFVTITNVEMAKDLRFAKIFYSVLGQDTDHQKTKQALDSSLGYIRKLIAERVQLRFTPEIVFKEDRSSEYSFQIQKVLDEIKKSDTA